MVILARSARPTRRDVLVAVFSGLCVLSILHFNSRVLNFDSNHSFVSVASGSSFKHETKQSNKAPLDSDHPRVPPVPTVPNPRGAAHSDLTRKATEIMPSTKIVAHAPGWTIFDNLYMCETSASVTLSPILTRLPQV